MAGQVSRRAVRSGTLWGLVFSVTLVAGAAMFLTIGALASTRRRAAAMAGVVFGIAYALRMAADSAPGLHWLVWLSPLGWIEESRPLTDPRPLALLSVLVLLVAITAVTLHLAAGRDLGAAGRLGLSCLLLVAAGLLAGIGAWAGAASQHSGVRFWSLVTAGLNVVPPGLFLLGLGALALGAWPRRTSAVVCGYLARSPASECSVPSSAAFCFTIGT